jgi:hypothetical protein
MSNHKIILNLNDLEIKLLRDATANLDGHVDPLYLDLGGLLVSAKLQLKIANAILDSSYNLPPIQQEPFVHPDFSGLGVPKSSSASIKINDRVEIKCGEGHVVKVINTCDGDKIKVVLDHPVEVRCYNGDVTHLQEFWVTSFDVKRI